MQELEALSARVAELILCSKRAVVFTGAGVSTESGIPDFRGPGGLWERYDPGDFTIERFLKSPESRQRIWHALGELLRETRPNAAHWAIAELEKLGKLDCVITQNVDGLHQQAGNSDQRVFELHGSLRQAICLSCGERYPMEHVRRLLPSGVAPTCEKCQGMLKPSAVFFGEALPQDEVKESIRRSRTSDLFVVVGSTLTVYPAAYMPVYAVEAGARLVIINLGPTPMDKLAAVVLRQKAGEALPRIVEKVRAGLSRQA
jgi:NAD-dependent deacetylase